MNGNCNLIMVNEYSELLLEFVASGADQQDAIRRLILLSDELMKDFSPSADDSIARLVFAVRSLLERHQGVGENLEVSDSSLLTLAGEWLMQLSALRREGLKEPEALLKEVYRLFDLSRVDFEMKHKDIENLGVDPFAEDEMFGAAPVSTLSAPFLNDPFAEDPGLSSGLERLQQTITYVKSAVSSRRQFEDPFAVDPAVVATDSKDGLNFNSLEDNLSGGDIFSEDPDLELD